MKTLKIISCILLFSTLYIFIIDVDSYAQQSNFQIAPSPIAYPYFTDGRSDGLLGASFISITSQYMTLTGGAAEFKGRTAFSDYTAIDIDFGMAGMGGSMPGIPPISPIYTSGAFHVPYYTQVAGDATLSFLSMRMSANLELQLLHDDIGSLILFGGPNLNFSQFTITTPFNLIVPPPWGNAGTVYKGYTDTLTINSTLTGWQMGMQMDIALATDFRLSPFFMISSFSGTANLSDTTTASGTVNTSLSADIPAASSMSFGMDIVIGDFSVGSLIQQMKKSKSSDQDVRVIMISVSYHFSEGAETSPAAEENAGKDSEGVK